MKILLTTESRQWSGGSVQTILLAQELRKRGHQVWIGCRKGSDIFEHAKRLGIPLFPLRIRGDADLIAVARLVAFSLYHRIDVLHAQHAKAHATGLIASLVTSRRLAFCVTRRVSFSPKPHFFSRWKYTASRIDALIAVSEGIKDVLIEAGIQAKKLHVIYSAVDPKTFAPGASTVLSELKRSLGLKPEVPVLIKVANYSDWKGQSVFLDAAKEVLQSGVNAQFLLVGRGNDGAEVAEQVRRLGIQKNVVALGFRSDVANLLAMSDASVNAAVAGEGLSGVLRESLFLGVPVVASDVSGNRELVEDGVTGRLVSARNPSALAKAMQWVLQNPAQARQFAQTGKKKVESLMLIERTAAQTESLYEKILRRDLARHG